jgi:fructokinase
MQSFICTLSPQRIILGGGVMEQSQLFPLIRENTVTLLNGYVQSPQILEHVDEYLVPVALGGKAGIMGAFVLAERAHEKN